jgi:hypothetical protein
MRRGNIEIGTTAPIARPYDVSQTRRLYSLGAEQPEIGVIAEPGVDLRSS